MSSKVKLACFLLAIFLLLGHFGLATMPMVVEHNQHYAITTGVTHTSLELANRLQINGECTEIGPVCTT